MSTDDRQDDGRRGRGFAVVDRRAARLDEDEGDARGEARGDKPSYVRQLERALEERDRKLREIASAHESSLADLEQARARIRREVSRELELGRRSMIIEFLDVLDNLERALEAAQQASDVATIVEGLTLVRDMFVGKLEGLGVTRLESLGARFDPSLHEALTTVPVEDSAADGMVVGVIKDGYAIGDEILRPAAVAVGKSPTTT